MRSQVIDNNIYRWAGMILSEAIKRADTNDGRLAPFQQMTPDEGLSESLDSE